MSSNGRSRNKRSRAASATKSWSSSMAPIAIGDKFPDGTLNYFVAQDQLQNVSVHSLTAGKKVILFGVPGAFSTVCSTKHVSSFIEKAKQLDFLCGIQSDFLYKKLQGLKMGLSKLERE